MKAGLFMKSKDMTQGNIWRLIITFAIPLFLGNLLQQTYNAIDAIVVGNYVGKNALAAVGSSGPLINMIIAFFMGMSTGASVLISQFFGARDEKSMHDTVHTAISLSLLLGIALSVAGVLISPVLLRLMATPEEIFLQATQYLRIYFGGLSALIIYNMGTAILTATGDSKRPLFFLAVSATLHVALNLLFVVWFKMGIAGVALGTVISQAVSAALVIIALCRATEAHKLILRDLRIHMSILKKIVIIGLPGGIQQAIVSVSNIAVQAYINGLGATAVAGYSACTKLDAFIMLPTQTIALAVTTFVGQNLGAHQVKRARQGTKNAIIMGLAITVTASIIGFIFSPHLLRIFSPEQEVVEAGISFMRAFIPGYTVMCFTQILPGALRGAGDVRVPTAACIASFVFVRQLYLFFATKISYTITVVAIGYPLTWAIAAVAIIIYYKRSDWRKFESTAKETV